jgi:hypothetical protein
MLVIDYVGRLSLGNHPTVKAGCLPGAVRVEKTNNLATAQCHADSAYHWPAIIALVKICGEETVIRSTKMWLLLTVDHRLHSWRHQLPAAGDGEVCCSPLELLVP